MSRLVGAYSESQCDKRLKAVATVTNLLTMAIPWSSCYLGIGLIDQSVLNPFTRWGAIAMPSDTEQVSSVQARIEDLRRQLIEAELQLACERIDSDDSESCSDQSLAQSIETETVEGLFRLAFEESSVGIAILDKEGRWLLRNQAFLKVFGEDVSSSSDPATGLFDLVHPEDQEALGVDLRMMAGQAKLVERRFRHSQTGLIWCRLNLSATLGTCCGSSPLRVCQVEDVTIRHLEALQDARERHLLAESIANAPIAIALFDTSMRYLAYSDHWVKGHGIDDRSILGRTHYEVMPDIPDRWRQVHRRCLLGEVIHADEDTLVLQDGSVQHWRWAVHPWHTTEGRIGGIIVVVDRIDDLVLARKTAIESSRLKSEFLANMSHEIRTPLNGVLGMVELLLETHLSPDQRDLATTTLENGQWLLKLISDILDFSRINSGKLDLETREFRLTTLVGDVADLMIQAADSKGIELLCDLPTDLSDCYLGDPNRIRQILLNLVGNAIKFTETGEVRISASALVPDSSIGGKGRPPTLRLSVHDTGIGIPPDRWEMIFESFTQGDGGTSRIYGGTGLGLSISSNLAQLLGGTIHLESEPGRGSTFHFDLPLAVARNGEPLGEVAESSHLQGETVLVADANASARGLIRTLLEEWGARVIEADSAAEVTRYLREPDNRSGLAVAIVSDRLADQITDLEETRLGVLGGLPLILMTVGATRSRLTNRGGLAIAKPILPASLLKVVTEAIRDPDRPPVPIPMSSAARAIASSRLAGVRVLLAEDNTTNQRVAVRMLHRLGCEPEVVADGSEVLSKLDQAEFDVILMDVAMPKMDGYEATNEVRRREASQSSSRHVPIIAMTAHAMQGDRERCLAARMDDYLSKPVTIAKLAEVLERWVGKPAPTWLAPPAPQPVAVTSQVPTLLISRLQELSLGDLDFERELLDCLLTDIANGMSRLMTTLSPLDPHQVANTFHGIVGACRTVGAEALGLLCRTCELSARQPGFQPDAAWLARIESEQMRLIAAVEAHLSR